jgi:predicted dehydrogenase
MVRTTPLRVGIAGTGIRGGHLAAALRDEGRTDLVAVQDPFPESRNRFAAEHRIEIACATFGELLDHVDVVILASPQQYHAPQACAALAREIHVLSEVPAAVSLEQAHALVAAARASGASYGLAENERWYLPHLVVGELIRGGELGDLYYGESDYINNVRAALHLANGEPTWRRFWWVGRDGNTYPTHSLGPLLSWMDDRIVAVSCVGAGRRSEYELQSTTVLLARTVSGKLLRVRFEWLSNQPTQSKWAVEGTEGAYFFEIGSFEALRSGAQGLRSGVHVRGRTSADVWDPIDSYIESHLPSRYTRPSKEIDPYGAGTPDTWMLQDFVDSIHTGGTFEVDVYRGLDLTLPGLVAEASIAQGGAWVNVPNPRFFTAGIGVDPGPESPLT